MFAVYASLLAFATALGEDLRVNLGDLPMQNPDLFEGDILGIDPTDDRAMITHTGRKWPNAVVQFLIHPSLKPYADDIQAAMNDYHENTCIRFKPWDQKTATSRDFIHLIEGRGCYSQVGKMGGPQIISLGKGCLLKAIIVHELGHAIGFFHEHSRSDRDKYLNIFWNNVQSGMESQFKILKASENILLDDFDFNSVMLYGETAFSRDGVSKTMESKTGVPLIEASEKPGLSKSDIFRINTYYNCKNQVRS